MHNTNYLPCVLTVSSLSAVCYACVKRHIPAEVLVGLQRLLPMTQTQQVPLINVQCDDLLKQLVQRLTHKDTEFTL